jgi:hypothetical protein
MSPQSSSLGLIGGDFFKSSTERTGFRSGIYRPEDNAYIRNYAENIDNFYWTGNTFTYPSTITDPDYLSGIFIKPELDRIYACGGSTQDINGSVSTDNSIYMNSFNENGKVSSITSPTTRQVTRWITGTFNNTISWYPEPTGLSFKPDGTQIIMAGNLVTTTASGTLITRGPVIFQYSISSGNAWNPNQIQGYRVGQIFTFLGTGYTVYSVDSTQFGVAPTKIYGFNSTATRIYDIFVHPDGTTFYYLMGGSNVITLYQGSISSAWDIGSAGGNLTFNTASLTINPNLVSSFSLTGYFSGITFNSTGTKLYAISKSYGGTIFQYNLGTPWQISTATFDRFLVVGQYKGEITGSPQGIIMLPDGETMICADLDSFTGKLYDYSVLPY